jgi:hypothetical protein
MRLARYICRSGTNITEKSILIEDNKLAGKAKAKDKRREEGREGGC